jgi:hypothetical protein
MTVTIPVWALWIGVPLLVLGLGALGLFAFMGWIYLDLIKTVGKAFGGRK